jgi:hypothetical protein
MTCVSTIYVAGTIANLRSQEVFERAPEVYLSDAVLGEAIRPQESE